MLKPVYVIDGRRWIPVARAAALLGIGRQTLKRLMGDGTIEWCQLRRNSTTLLALEADIVRLQIDRLAVRTRKRQVAVDVQRPKRE